MLNNRENILEKIYDSALRFLTPLNLEETFQLIIKEALKLVKAEIGSIFLYQDGKLSRIYASHPGLFKIQIRKRGLTYKVFRTGVPTVVHAPILRKIHQYVLNGLDVRSDVILPLSTRGKPFGALSLMSVKDHKFTEKELALLKFFGPFASLAITKAQLYNETKEALEARSVFISMAAHELRTPITTIYGYAQLLERKTNGTKGVEGKWIKELHAETHRLSLLVNDLLEINRMKSGHAHYVLRHCDLKEVINEAIESLHINHPNRVIFFKDGLNDKKVTVIGDFAKLFQVIINLLDNAVKFSSENIILRLEYEKPDFIIQIKDKGEGIAEKDIPKLFEVYQRGSSTDREGIGLGLFLSKNIIERHRGSIDIKSKLGKGTIVTVKLPHVRI